MMEIRDTFWGSHDAETEKGKVSGGGITLPIWLGGQGSVINLSSGVRGKAPAENGFGALDWIEQGLTSPPT